MRVASFLKKRVEQLKRNTYALYLAYKDPRVPLYAKIFIVAVVGYVVSPLDLIPEFIPVIGYFDDLVILSAGIYFTVKIIPNDVWDDCKKRAVSEPIDRKLKWLGTFLIVFIYIFIISLIVLSYLRRKKGG